MDLNNLNNKSKEELEKIALAVQSLSDNKKYNYLDYIFPEEGKLKRDGYPKHMQFFEAGSKHSRRAFIAANRVGKSVAGGFELVCHATGRYPKWWKGKRFSKPINAWVAGVTSAALRESIQEILFGNFADKGTGLFPKESLLNENNEMMTWAMPGTPNCVGTCLVNHISGGRSKIEFKAYEQGWEKFQGAKRDVIWLDEEPTDRKIYSECSTRTAGDEGKEGILFCTFTPLHGISEVVLEFLPSGVVPPNGVHPEQPHKFVVCAGWDDVPHLSEQWKKAQLLEYSPNERDARSKGIPSMGSGRVYPILEENLVVKPFKIPEYFPRAYGMDFGWNVTAAVWGAKDPVTGTIYIYSEYYGKKQAPYVHANAIMSKGKWIPGICDPSGGGRNHHDGSMLSDEYRNLGLDLTEGDNSLAAGIARVLNMMESGQLKVFSNLEHWLEEFRVYRYDLSNPNIPARNQNDHLMDATRYLLSLFEWTAKSQEDHTRPHYSDVEDIRRDSSRDPTTGY